MRTRPRLTFGETTLINSFKNRNFPTSLWNLLPQFFMHASSTCGHRTGLSAGGLRGRSWRSARPCAQIAGRFH